MGRITLFASLVLLVISPLVIGAEDDVYKVNPEEYFTEVKRQAKALADTIEKQTGKRTRWLIDMTNGSVQIETSDSYGGFTKVDNTWIKNNMLPEEQSKIMDTLAQLRNEGVNAKVRVTLRREEMEGFMVEGRQPRWRLDTATPKPPPHISPKLSSGPGIIQKFLRRIAPWTISTGIMIGVDAGTRLLTEKLREIYDKTYADCMRRFLDRIPSEELAGVIDEIDKRCRQEAKHIVDNELLRRAPEITSLGMDIIERLNQRLFFNEPRARNHIAAISSLVRRTLSLEELEIYKEEVGKILADPNISNDVKKEAAELLQKIESRKQVIEEFSQWLKNNRPSYDTSTQAPPSGPTLPQQQSGSTGDRRGFKTANRGDGN